MITGISAVFLACAMILGLCFGSSGAGLNELKAAARGISDPDSLTYAIIWKIRFPRVFLAVVLGATLSLGGLVFQALLRNPLAEPYILGISGGSAIGAITGILLNLSHFPISFLAFLGGMTTLGAVLIVSSGRTILKKEALLLAGIMVNAFCSAIIMFLISLTQDSRIHNIMFWLMGDISSTGITEALFLAGLVIPCFILIFLLSNPMNLLLMGKEMAYSMGVNVRLVSISLLVVASFMVSATVCQCGLVAFVGLVIPHLFRLLLGPDHRVLVPSCILGGGAYLVLCDLLARTIPRQGEMPVGVLTALIGAPFFILLLRRSNQ